MLIGHSGLRHQTFTLIKRRQLLLCLEKNRSLVLKPGDGVIYKGCERPHWRDTPCLVLIKRETRKLFGKSTVATDTYYHQIFFHYVLQDGQRAHCAWDRAR